MEQTSRRGFLGLIGKLACLTVAAKIPIVSRIAAPVARKFDSARFHAITAKYIIPTVADNIFKSNPLFLHLKNMSETTLSGGDKIEAPFVIDNDEDAA